MTTLAQALLAELGASGESAACVEEIDAALVAICEDAERAWPEIALSRPTFVAHVAGRLERGADVRDELRSVRATDLYLACACAAGDAQAIAVFERQHLAYAERVVTRMGMPPAIVDELKQLLRVRFFIGESDRRPRILAYRGRGDLQRWVRASAVRGALRLLRGRSARLGAADDDVLESLADVRQDFELDFLKRTYGGAFEGALRDAFVSLAPRDRNLLRYYFGKRLSIDELGVIYHVHRATAARRVRKATDELVAVTRDRLAARLGIDPKEVSSILRLVQSQIELTLRSVVVDERAESAP